MLGWLKRVLQRNVIKAVHHWTRNWWSASTIPRASQEAVMAMMQTQMSTAMVQKLKVVFKQISSRLLVVCWNRLKAGVPDPEAQKEALRAKAENLYAKMTNMSLGQRVAALKLASDEDIVALLEAMPDEERADMLLRTAAAMAICVRLEA